MCAFATRARLSSDSVYSRGRFYSLRRVGSKSAASPKRARWTRPAVRALAAGGASVISTIVVGCAGDAPNASPSTENGADIAVSYASEGSRCTHDLVVGNVDFVIYLRNDGTDPAEVRVLPIRRYTDGESNRSPLDEIYATIPPDGKPHLVWHAYEIRPTHTLAACEARITTDDAVMTIEVPVGGDATSSDGTALETETEALDVMDPPTLPDSAAGIETCGSAQNLFGSTYDVYLVRPDRGFTCAEARAVVESGAEASGWTYWDWTKGGNGPWSDVWQRDDGEVVVAAVITDWEGKDG